MTKAHNQGEQGEQSSGKPAPSDIKPQKIQGIIEEKENEPSLCQI
jgi:hypothetical protein